jgi:hypothetical protein
MSQRKKPASKRPAPDPLGGPEEAAALARADAEAAAPAELRPHKIIGQLIGARYNEHNEIVGEEVMGEVAIFKPNFGKLEELVEEAVAAAGPGGA